MMTTQTIWEQVDGEWVSREEAYIPPLYVTTINDYETAIQSMVDAAARSRRYTDGNALAGYVASTIPAWAAEAQVFVAWRDGVWQYSYAELEKVQAGEREQPTVEAFVQELPQVVWP